MPASRFGTCLLRLLSACSKYNYYTEYIVGGVNAPMSTSIVVAGKQLIPPYREEGGWRSQMVCTKYSLGV